MSRSFALFGILFLIVMIFPTIATEEVDTFNGLLLHLAIELVTVGFIFFYCGFATLHAVQHVPDPVERSLWVVMTVVFNVVGSCYYFMTEYQKFRKAGKGGLILAIIR